MKRFLTILFLFISCFSWAQTKKKKSKEPTLAQADSLFAAQQYLLAKQHFEILVKKQEHKANAVAWNRLALSYFNLKEYEQSLQAFEEVYRINPRFQFNFINRAKAFSALNNIGMALQMLDSANSKLGYSNFKLLESDPSFENLRKDARYKEIYDKMYNTAYPCLSIPEARQFDFWLGDWDVYATANLTVKTGFNRITMQSGGCVILESWEAIGPHQGVSTNYFDPTSKPWKQKWAGSSQDITEFYDGQYENGAMRFKWDVPPGSGTPSIGRLTFTNLEPGKVRQHSETSSDNGVTWQTVYDFTYIRRK